MSGPYAEIVVLLEGDISDVEDADLQDDVEEETLTAAVRGRVLDEGAPAGETLNIDYYSMPVEIHMRNDDDEEDKDDTPVCDLEDKIKVNNLYMR